jgi:hypothetical protein
MATISPSVLIFFMRFRHPDLPGASMPRTCLIERLRRAPAGR